MRAIEREMAIVVPCMNESRHVLEGVLSGIPHECLIVLVSNSSRDVIDHYRTEVAAVEQYCRLAERPALTIHQRDPGLAVAVKAAGMPELLDDDGLVRPGKGEALLLGMALADLSGRRYVGFVDADNYVPGAVHEYCRAYAAGLHLAESPYAMVRIAWHSKPKLKDGRIFFSRYGRSSEVTNRFLNRLLAEYSGFGTEVISTGNAGEHAVSLELGRRMRLAGGFAAEPFQFIDLFEQFGGILDSAHPGRDGPLDSGAADRLAQPALPRRQGRGPRQRHAPAGAQRALPLARLPARGARRHPGVHGGRGRDPRRRRAAGRSGSTRRYPHWTCR